MSGSCWTQPEDHRLLLDSGSNRIKLRQVDSIQVDTIRQPKKVYLVCREMPALD